MHAIPAMRRKGSVITYMQLTWLNMILVIVKADSSPNLMLILAKFSAMRYFSTDLTDFDFCLESMMSRL